MSNGRGIPLICLKPPGFGTANLWQRAASSVVFDLDG
jgi:hypothetical protein